MTDQLRENYFLAVKTTLVLASEIYLLIQQNAQAGASGRMFLLLALFFGILSCEALTNSKYGIVWCLLLMGEAALLVIIYDAQFLLLCIIAGYETVSGAKAHALPGTDSLALYALPLAIPLLAAGSDMLIQEMTALFIGVIYLQHDFVVESYRRQITDSTRSEMHLKKNMNRQEHAFKEELHRGILVAENQLLEERARLSQTLHDKLGHSINGSIYQLEAVKVLLDKDMAASHAMIQAVIDQLRTGMDEIRAILRQERPEKYRLATLQLQRLCDECRKLDIDAVLNIQGDLSRIPDQYLEIVLDNACEAVTNALKYAHCTRIEITLIVMNQMLRCSIKDNGIGCSRLTDGMGIAGMRQRMRSINGVLSFDTENGFAIGMLMPIQTQKDADDQPGAR